jgi:hypothetical protein
LRKRGIAFEALDNGLGEDAFQALQRPRHVDGQRAAALRALC